MICRYFPNFECGECDHRNTKIQPALGDLSSPRAPSNVLRLPIDIQLNDTQRQKTYAQSYFYLQSAMKLTLFFLSLLPELKKGASIAIDVMPGAPGEDGQLTLNTSIRHCGDSDLAKCVIAVLSQRLKTYIEHAELAINLALKITGEQRCAILVTSDREARCSIPGCEELVLSDSITEQTLVWLLRHGETLDGTRLRIGETEPVILPRLGDLRRKMRQDHLANTATVFLPDCRILTAYEKQNEFQFEVTHSVSEIRPSLLTLQVPMDVLDSAELAFKRSRGSLSNHFERKYLSVAGHLIARGVNFTNSEVRGLRVSKILSVSDRAVGRLID